MFSDLLHWNEHIINDQWQVCSSLWYMLRDSQNHFEWPSLSPTSFKLRNEIFSLELSKICWLTCHACCDKRLAFWWIDAHLYFSLKLWVNISNAHLKRHGISFPDNWRDFESLYSVTMVKDHPNRWMAMWFTTFIIARHSISVAALFFSVCMNALE